MVGKKMIVYNAKLNNGRLKQFVTRELTLLYSFNMVLKSCLFAALLCFCQAQSSENEGIPLLIATQGGQSELKVSNLLPEIEETDVPLLTGVQSAINKGRGDVEIEEEEETPRGYFYPKPERPFNLPKFKTLDGNVPLDGVSFFVQEDNLGIDRVPRSIRRRPRPNFPSPPPFVPGFFPSGNYRPLPALYGRPGRF